MAAPFLNRVRSFDAATNEMDVRGILSAALMADWREAFVARGFGWHADEGAFSTPAAGGGAAAVIDQDRPNLLISCPTGYTMVITRAFCAAQTPLLATDADESEILMAVDIAAAAAGIGAATTAVTPVNMRTNIASGCPATVYKTLSANITNPTLGLELARNVVTGDMNGTPANALWGNLTCLYEPLNPLFLVGPCCFYLYHGGTVATTGFSNVDFLMFQSTLVTGLS